jgi:hypothetical protein
MLRSLFGGANFESFYETYQSIIDKPPVARRGDRR